MNNEEINAVIEKSREKIAVSQFKNEKVEEKKRSITKMAASIIMIVGLGVGIVYAAGTAADNKIWKEPESYVVNYKLTDEEIAKAISEEEAEKIGNSFLKEVIGFDEETIKGLELEKRIFDTEKNVWTMYSNRVATLTISGETGDIVGVNIPTFMYKIPYNYGIKREEARVVAKELFEKYKPKSDTGEYEFVELKKNMETDEGSYIWYAKFYKKYGDMLNPYEVISIGWIPTINGLYSLGIARDVYENNEEIISREEAIKIAIDKEKIIEKNKNSSVSKAEIRIEKMNEEVYLRENFKEEYEDPEKYFYMHIPEEGTTHYKTEGRVRKVWVVVIKYEGVNDRSFTYFVDATTGEIIGGQGYDTLAREETERTTVNNLIEK